MDTETYIEIQFCRNFHVTPVKNSFIKHDTLDRTMLYVIVICKYFVKEIMVLLFFFFIT
jgi:hypothetical protein